MFIIKGLLDRVFFAAGVMLFMQVPHLVDQYAQRLGGYYQAQVSHLEQYQQIANKQHQGNLDALIQEFESSARVSVQEAGGNVRSIRDEAHSLKTDVDVFTNQRLVFKLAHLVTGLHYDVAKETIKTYKPGVSLSIEGFVCGVIGGVLLSLLFNTCLFFPKLFKRKQKPASKAKAGSQRIEPTVMRVSRARQHA